MKKLLLMVPMLHQGGFERVCVKTARVLQGIYDVTILIFSDKDINYDITGLKVVNIDVPSVKGKAGKVLNVLKRIAKVRAFKKKEGFDISYSFGSSANLINVFSRQKEKVLTGLRCQTDLEEPGQVRLFTRRSDRVLSCSKEIMRQLKSDYGYDRSSYIYNPLDIADIRAKAEEPVQDMPFEKERQMPNHKILIGMGREDYIKGFWHLIKAFSLVRKTYPEARLIILGAGKFENYRKLAEDLGQKDCIAFPGVRKNPFPYVAGADLFVLPSNHEGFPNALLEAMALARPVVAADCKTGPREILLTEDEYGKLIEEAPDGSSIKETQKGEYGILVPDMDEHEDFDAGNITEEDIRLAGAIEEMLADPSLMEHYSRKALERAGTYTPEKYRDALDGILTEIV